MIGKPTKNWDEFLELINIYENITIEDILEKEKELNERAKVEKGISVKKDIYHYGGFIMLYMTNFGTADCMLCKNVSSCGHCTYSKLAGDVCSMITGYHEIREAPGPEELIYAIKLRAVEMRKIVEKR